MTTTAPNEGHHAMTPPTSNRAELSIALRGMEREVRSLIASENPTLVEARNAIPGYTDRMLALTALAHIEQGMRSATPRSTEDLAREIVAQLGTDSLPAATDIDDAVREIALAETVAATRSALMGMVRTQAVDSASSLILNNLDTLRRHLHRALTAIVEEVRGNQLHDVAEPASAIASNRVADHQRFNELATEYGGIRTAQRLVDRVDLGAGATADSQMTYKLASTLRGIPQAWPGYARWAMLQWPPGGPPAPPWPSLERSSVFLAWLGGATDMAPWVPWVPTRRDLDLEMRVLASARRAEEVRDIEAITNRAS